MKKSTILVFAIALLGLSACSDVSGDREKLAQLSASFKDVIGEDGLGIRTKKGKAAALKLATAYEKFVETYPEDSLAPEYLFMSAVDLHLNTLEDTEKSLEILKKVYTQYPKHDRAAWALFETGFIYGDHLRDLTQAKTAFDAYLEKYPKHKLKETVLEEIRFLGVPIEERLRIIRQALPDSLLEDSTPTL